MMLNLYNTVMRLTSQEIPPMDLSRMLNDFAYELGWIPSDRLDVPKVQDIANAHLVVEHGLQNTAVITFLRTPRSFSDLRYDQKRKLLSISYNNLVDWHVQIQNGEVLYIYNRTDPPDIIEHFDYTESNIDKLRKETFDQIVGRSPSPNLPALDEALIDTVSLWKRNISAEMGYVVPNAALSALFNAIIFTRAVEDHQMRVQERNSTSRALLEAWENDRTRSIKDIVFDVLTGLIGNPPEFLVNRESLSPFDDLDHQTVYALLSNFYRNKYASYYEYDFSIMSKHALSRIYEHYVSVLRVDETESQQLSFRFLSRLPEEERERAYGSYYTPQYIARFFGKYLREQMPPSNFRRIQTIDPACGSGIFLRTILELQCDPTHNLVTTQFIEDAFGRVFGMDVDDNASQAARLSLSLLYLALTGQLPSGLNILSEEAIGYFQEHPELSESFEAVIANPPFVPWDSLDAGIRDRITEFMQGYARGRIDTYLAFLRIGLEMLKPGGYGLFVLPHNFLLSKNASRLRQIIAETCWIHCLADLSTIQVFEESSAYVILLIFQKKSDRMPEVPTATIVKCQDFVGQALQEAVEGRHVESKHYSIYEVDQEIFLNDEWIIVPPSETRIKRRFERLPKISEFLFVREGFISGADDIFIVSKEQVPQGEEHIFVPYLRDREMQSYTVPESTSKYFFYPYLDGQRVDEIQLKSEFHQTWGYLRSHRDKLEARSPVVKSKLDWWRPVRPRLPKNMMRPKIISPHLSLVPRFSIDVEGKYAISRAPLLYPKDTDEDTGVEVDLLKYFVAVLNSTACYWYIATHSHTYERGYALLEPKTLKQTPVPDPKDVPPRTMRRLLNLVDKRLQASEESADQLEEEIDMLVAEIYGLTAEERFAIGLEDVFA